MFVACLFFVLPGGNVKILYLWALEEIDGDPLEVGWRTVSLHITSLRLWMAWGSLWICRCLGPNNLLRSQCKSCWLVSAKTWPPPARLKGSCLALHVAPGELALECARMNSSCANCLIFLRVQGSPCWFLSEGKPKGNKPFWWFPYFEN